jgi:hypothetical protein
MTSKEQANKQLMVRAEKIQALPDAIQLERPEYDLWQLGTDLRREGSDLEGLVRTYAHRSGFPFDDELEHGDADLDEMEQAEWAYSTTTAEDVARCAAKGTHERLGLKDPVLIDLAGKLHKATREAKRIGILGVDLKDLLERRIRLVRHLPCCSELWTLDGESHYAVHGHPVRSTPPGRPRAIRSDAKFLVVFTVDKEGRQLRLDSTMVTPQRDALLEDLARVGVARQALSS